MTRQELGSIGAKIYTYTQNQSNLRASAPQNALGPVIFAEKFRKLYVDETLAKTNFVFCFYLKKKGRELSKVPHMYEKYKIKRCTNYARGSSGNVL